MLRIFCGCSVLFVFFFFVVVVSGFFVVNDFCDLVMVLLVDVGMDVGKFDEFKNVMYKVVDDGKFVGVIIVVVCKGKVVLFDVYGKVDVESGRDLIKDSIFCIYLMIKLIVGVVLMMQWEQGKFKFDDLVEKYIFEWKGMRVLIGEMDGDILKIEFVDYLMMMCELMMYIGGFIYGFFLCFEVDMMYQKVGIFDFGQMVEDMMMKFVKILLCQQLGLQWYYSVLVDVQGYLVEKFIGMLFDEVFKKLIFELFGMEDIDFWVLFVKVDCLMMFYVLNCDGGFVVQEQVQIDYFNKFVFFGGGGGFVLMVGDYLCFVQMFVNGGEFDGVCIFKFEIVQLMYMNYLFVGVDFINLLIGNFGNIFGFDFVIVEEFNGLVDYEFGKGEYWWYGIGGMWFGINFVQDLIVVGMI